MKRSTLLVLAFLIAGGAAFAQDADPITEATVHAREDAGSYKGTGWGSLAFGASVLLSPLLGGGGVILAANLVEPYVDIPTARLAQAQKEFTDTSDLLLYQSQYQEEMVEPMQKERSRRAWIGTGIGFGVNLLLIVALLGA
ncbi:MAG: hypothetical protein ACOC2N_02500 [Spirochaetota bacterium]